MLGPGGGDDVPRSRHVEHAVHRRRHYDEDRGLEAQAGRGANHFVFLGRTPPPFYACDAPRSDVVGGRARDKRTKRPPLEAAGGGAVAEPRWRWA